ncbi:MAG: RNA helicase [Methanomicrobiales archaeon]|nr:RNA helicase [Methanomicrobiales archaeon]
MIAGRARFHASKKIQNIVGYRIPDLVFTGSFLEAILSAADYDRMDRTLKEQILRIIDDFLDCRCAHAPLCGCPERKFSRLILELRETGLDHRQISAYLLEEYGIDLYPADILSFLEDSVHVLEAIRDVAALEGEDALKEKADAHISRIER